MLTTMLSVIVCRIIATADLWCNGHCNRAELTWLRDYELKNIGLIASQACFEVGLLFMRR